MTTCYLEPYLEHWLVEELIFWGSIIIDEFMDPGQGAGG